MIAPMQGSALVEGMASELAISPTIMKRIAPTSVMRSTGASFRIAMLLPLHKLCAG